MKSDSTYIIYMDNHNVGSNGRILIADTVWGERGLALASVLGLFPRFSETIALDNSSSCPSQEEFHRKLHFLENIVRFSFFFSLFFSVKYCYGW